MWLLEHMIHLHKHTINTVQGLSVHKPYYLLCHLLRALKRRLTAELVDPKINHLNTYKSSIGILGLQ